MSFEISGKLIEKFDTVKVSDRFKKREFVIEKTESNGGMEFTDHIKFQLTQDRCNLIDAMNLNDDIKVHFNIRGNKWEKDGKVSYFTNLDAWRIENVNAQNQGNMPDDTPPP
ncbi:MAG TPA: DUF3127 domain-containing protein, partial [Bacteroidales bacterium]|nr:DUF3127 domain-containing protein [Bacteroidales bacterium]